MQHGDGQIDVEDAHQVEQHETTTGFAEFVAGAAFLALRVANRETLFRSNIVLGNVSFAPWHCKTLPPNGMRLWDFWEFSHELRIRNLFTAKVSALQLALVYKYVHDTSGSFRKRPGEIHISRIVAGVVNTEECTMAVKRNVLFCLFDIIKVGQAMAPYMYCWLRTKRARNEECNCLVCQFMQAIVVTKWIVTSRTQDSENVENLISWWEAISKVSKA